MVRYCNTLIIAYHSRFLFTILLLTTIQEIFCQQHDLKFHNGGSIMAMVGSNSLAVIVDKRFGYGAQTVTISPRTIFVPHSHLLVGFTGLEGDVQSICDELSVKVLSEMNSHATVGCLLKGENHYIKSRCMSVLLSHILYKKRRSPYYVESIVAGLDKLYDANCNMSYSPFLCGHDVIGARIYSETFICCGAASKSLYGNAETMWRPNLSQEDLMHICGKVFLNALERDCLSGSGAILYLITSNKGIIKYDLTTRTD